MGKVLIFFFLLIIKVHGQIIDSTNWDNLELPSEGLSWPSFYGQIYDNWKPCDYTDDNYSDACELDTTHFVSPPRSLKFKREANKHGVVDIWYTLNNPRKKIFLSFFCYFSSQGWSSNPGYNIPYDGNGINVHFIFINRAVAPALATIDFIQYSDFRGWPPTCIDESNGGVFPGFLSSNYDSNGGQQVYGSTNSNDCWNVRLNTDRWIFLEFMWDLEDNRCGMWVNGVKKIDSEFFQYSLDLIEKIGLSGWVSQASQIGWDAIHYIDNIKISESYIGPPGYINTPPQAPRLERPRQVN